MYPNTPSQEYNTMITSLHREQEYCDFSQLIIEGTIESQTTPGIPLISDFDFYSRNSRKYEHYSTLQEDWRGLPPGTEDPGCHRANVWDYNFVIP